MNGSMRFPAPNVLSGPGVPRSLLCATRYALTCAIVSDGYRWWTSAAAPAMYGVAADVPAKPPPPLQLPNAPYVRLDTRSGPTRSGLIRPSSVGPRELNGSPIWFCQQTAPTASVFGEAAGSTRLSASVSQKMGLTPPVTNTDRKSTRLNSSH